MLSKSVVTPQFLNTLIFLLVSRVSTAQVDTEDPAQPPDAHGDYVDDAFFALRSCHQLLHGDSGQFFSPDYLCSNPALWCNWTIQAEPGKRLHLHLEDLTPADACHLKQDQVHVDEPGAHSGIHKILQKCWREVRYTTASNTVNVVLLIGGWPGSPYRGFHGHYQAFGPPVMYHPQEVLTTRSHNLESPLGPAVGATEFRAILNVEPASSEVYPTPPDFDHTMDLPGSEYDYYDQHSAMTAGASQEPKDVPDTEVVENLRPSSGWNLSHVYPITAVPTVPVSLHGTSRSGRDVPGTVLTPVPVVAVPRNMEEPPVPSQEEPTVNGTEVSDASDQQSATSKETSRAQPGVVEPLSDNRGRDTVRNLSEPPHLPGDHLYELAVEVNFSPGVGELWDDAAMNLLLSLKTLISEQLVDLLNTAPLSISTKRIKRLNGGVLFLLWLQTPPQLRDSHRSVHTAVHSLQSIDVGLRGIDRRALIISVTIADVDECGTQLVLCDANADCVNHFGSYACHCRPGFLDQSRLGSGGTFCVDAEAAGCSTALSAETKGVYVLFFLLSSLILMLLTAAGVLYRRHHQGAFLVQCHRGNSSLSPPDPNNNGRYDDGCSDAPPPPPPRGSVPREAWQPVKELNLSLDLPLLRFSSLPPSDAYMEPREGGKM